MDLAADRASGHAWLPLPTLAAFQLLRVFCPLLSRACPVSGRYARCFRSWRRAASRHAGGHHPDAPGFTYRLSESHALFAINSSTGALYTTATIDRESLPSDVINLVVLSSSPTYPTEVRVLRDLNDNAPVFPEPSIVVTFKEDSSGKSS